MGRRGVNQTELGQVLDLSQPPMSKRLHGLLPFNIDELERLAAFFDVPIVTFIPPATGPASRSRGDNLGYAAESDNSSLVAA